MARPEVRESLRATGPGGDASSATGFNCSGRSGGMGGGMDMDY